MERALWSIRYFSPQLQQTIIRENITFAASLKLIVAVDCALVSFELQRKFNSAAYVLATFGKGVDSKYWLVATEYNTSRSTYSFLDVQLALTQNRDLEKRRSKFWFQVRKTNRWISNFAIYHFKIMTLTYDDRLRGTGLFLHYTIHKSQADRNSMINILYSSLSNFAFCFLI